jgi:phosphoglucomutase
MDVHELAGKLVPRSYLVNIPRLVAAYYTHKPDVSDPSQRVAFGTSGHRGSSLKNSFNENHISAISQGITEYRLSRNIQGPLFLGMDTHALSEAALGTALEVFAAAGITVMIQKGLRYTPTPVISHAILTYNRGRKTGLADGAVITPSHNPPEDGGFKYNPPEGGPAEPETTRIIEERANQILAQGLPVRRIPFERALKADTTHKYDYISPYVEDLENVVDMKIIREKGLRIGADPLGGSVIDFWGPIAERYGLSMEIVNPVVDPTFSFMTLDKDGKIRMDCSSPYAMARLIQLKNNYDLAFGNDPDVDRHGIVTRGGGLMNPNAYLSAAVWYLFQNRPNWRKEAAVGKTLVSTSMIDRVASFLGRRLSEVPVGFKWFVDGLLDGSYGFGGEESAGASFLRINGSVWTTDKDGIIMDLLAAEMMARSGKDPAIIYEEMEEKFGRSYYIRLDIPASAPQREVLKKLLPNQVKAKDIGGEAILSITNRAPGNNSAIGGIKVSTPYGWFSARPSGTEDIYKVYAESFKGESHLDQIVKEAQMLVESILAEAGIPSGN